VKCEALIRPHSSTDRRGPGRASRAGERIMAPAPGLLRRRCRRGGILAQLMTITFGPSPGPSRSRGLPAAPVVDRELGNNVTRAGHSKTDPRDRVQRHPTLSVVHGRRSNSGCLGVGPTSCDQQLRAFDCTGSPPRHSPIQPPPRQSEAKPRPGTRVRPVAHWAASEQHWVTSTLERPGFLR